DRLPFPVCRGRPHGWAFGHSRRGRTDAGLMPTINKRFLLKLLLVLFAFTGALVAAHAVQAKRIPAALKLQAERAADAGKTDVAIHYLRQYLEFHPDDVEA